MSDLRPARERLLRLLPERAALRIMELLDLGRPVRILVTFRRTRAGDIHVEIKPPSERYKGLTGEAM